MTKPKFNTADVSSLFQTSSAQTEASTKPRASQTVTRPKGKAKATANESTKTVNHSAKTANRTAETRSQRRQLLLTKYVNDNLEILANIKFTSVNQIANDLFKKYIDDELAKAEVQHQVEAFKKTPAYKKILSRDRQRQVKARSRRKAVKNK